MNHFNYMVIGAGSGGISSARWAAQKLGQNVLIIEHQRLGGTCVNVGCIPKKIMWSAANFLEDLHHIDRFGMKTTCDFDWKVIKQQRDAYILKLNGIYETLLKETTVVKGYASFIDNKTVEVNGVKYSADHINIASGTTPYIDPSIEGIEYCETSDEFFSWEEQPKRCVVLGGGYIAVELAGILNTLGTDVTQYVRSDILRFLDTEVSEVLKRNMALQKMKLVYKVTLKKVEKVEGGFLCTFSDGTQKETDKIVVSTGRVPKIERLNLQNTDIKLNKDNTIITDKFGNTSVPNIYSIGDVSNQSYQLTPVAIKQGRTLVERLFNNKPNLAFELENTIPTVIFSHPPIGVIGENEQTAAAKYGAQNIKTYKSVFYSTFHSLNPNFEEREKCLFKLICLTGSEKIIGVHAIGRGIDEILQGVGIAVKMGATKRDFDNCVPIHPTSAEEFCLMDPQYNYQ